MSLDVILQELEPREPFLKWFESGMTSRPDNRPFDYIPEISFQTDFISTAEGSVLLKFDETTVVVAVKTEVSEPSVSHPDRGYIVTNFHLASGARADVKPGPPTEEVQEITDKLSTIFSSGDVIRPEDLMLKPNELAYVLFIDIVCLSDSGHAFEASLLGSLLAFRSARLYTPELIESTGMVCVTEDSRRAISLSSIPIPINFGVFNQDILLSSPNLLESRACKESNVRILFDLVSGELLSLEKSCSQMCDEKLFEHFRKLMPEYRSRFMPLFGSIN